jgi:hypothetical protein
LRKLDGAQICIIEVETISDHQLYLIILSRADHRFAILFGGGHRFFAKHMGACTRGAFGVAVKNMDRF